MKFSISNDNLYSLIAAAAAVSKSPDPVKIIAERIGDGGNEEDHGDRPVEAGRVRILAYNDAMVAEWRRPAEIHMAGSATIHLDGLDRLVRVSRNAESSFTLETLETDNSKSLRISTSRSAHEFPEVDGSVFDVITPSYTTGRRGNLGNLATAITTAKLAAESRGDAAGGRIMLSGVHIQARDGLIDIVGTDGKRLALTTLKTGDIASFNINDAPKGITIPPESIGLVTDMLGGPETCLEVVENNLIVESREGTLSVRLIDLPYPDYTRLLGMPTDKSIRLPRAAFDMALQRSSVTLARDKRSVAVKLTQAPDGIHLTSSAAGQSSSECISTEASDEVSIGFDARYMQNAISAYGAGEVLLEFSADNVPIKITSRTHPEILMLVMPCKIA